MQNPRKYEINRRQLLHTVGGVTVGGALGATHGLARSSEHRPRRLLFNWDGSMIHCFGRTALGLQTEALTVDQFKDLVFTPLGSQSVDAVFFSFGSGNVAEYESRVLEWPGQADRFKFPESQAWHGGVEVDPADQYRNPKALADAGHNPPQVLVEACHERGMDAFASLRMNDCHDGQHPPGQLPNPELPTFKRQNPDWLVEDLDWWSALDYRHPRVRALKLRVIRELFERWDFDGIELDWLRHTLYFPRGTEAANGKHLTTFMRSVKKLLHQLGEQRGRRIEIAVRIPERVDWCHEGGFEITKWMQEDLVDLLVLGQSLTTVPAIEQFREISKHRHIPIYPCLTPFGNGYGLSPDEVVRGTAMRLWDDGVDGICAYNWFFQGPWREHLLREIASPESMQPRNKRFTVTQRVFVARGQPGADYIRYNVQGRDAPLPVRLKLGEATGVDVSFAGSTASLRDAVLWLQIDFLGQDDEFNLSVNGQSIAVPTSDDRIDLTQLGGQVSIPAGQGMLGFPKRTQVDEQFEGIEVPLPPEVLRVGDNRVEIRLVKRTAGGKHDPRVSRVELDCRYTS